ncbi:MAG TPA: tetratricopeptide repeat protein [Polyangia bacterium]|nr:tetratricopeptide repeat protein [Polyangia bacterium]
MRIATGVAIVVLMCASRARAQPENPVLAQVLELNRKALDDYDNLNFDEARAELKEALALCDRHALGHHPIRARTYVNLGVVLLAADAAHPEVAIAQFRRAFQIQPDVQLPVRFANPEVAQAFADAKRDVSSGAAPANSASAPAPSSAAGPPSSPPAKGQASAPAPAETLVRAPPPRAPGPTDDTGQEEEEEDQEADRVGPRWLFAMGVGSGFGWVSGNGEVNSDLPLPSGFQPSSVVHLSPEVGYFVRPNLALSLQGRFQLISGTTPERSPSGTGCGGDGLCTPSKGASAIFARASFFFGAGALRPFVSATLGAGQIRHVVPLPAHNDCGADPAHPVACVDTAVAGPIFFGPGGGAMIDLASHFALTLGATALLGVSNFTAHVDVSAGLVVKL